jgi:hypothetical protein
MIDKAIVAEDGSIIPDEKYRHTADGFERDDVTTAGITLLESEMAKTESPIGQFGGPPSPPFSKERRRIKSPAKRVGTELSADTVSDWLIEVKANGVKGPAKKRYEKLDYLELRDQLQKDFPNGIRRFRVKRRTACD